MLVGSVGAVLGSIASFVLKYGAIWLALYAARYLIVLWIVDPYRSFMRYLPGPPTNGHFNDKQLHDLQNVRLTKQLYEKYEKEYGNTIRFQGMAYFDLRMMTIDPLAINYMLNRAADIFHKPWQTRRFIGRLVGGGARSNGIFSTEGEEHRKLRRIIAPAFSFQSIKNLAPLFLHKSFELRDKLRAVLAEEHTVSKPGVEVEQFPGEPHPRMRMDLHIWIGRATFDIIGVAGFGYEFRSIQEENNKFYNAYRCMFNALRQAENMIHNLGIFFPGWIASRIPDARTKEVRRCREIIDAESRALFAKRREAIASEKAAGGVMDKDFTILNLLLRANESSKAPLSDEDILAQVDSIMFAGHDTTSIAIEWALWELTRYPAIQARLREELAPLVPMLKGHASACASDMSNTYADLGGELGELAASLDALPYFENFVREVLRLHPSIHSTLRVAEQDEIIPVSQPIRAGENGEMSKAWVGGNKTGTPGGGVRIRKGEFVNIPIEGMNVTKQVWGEDAHDFNPDRWDNLPAAAKANPGLYASLMTFSIGPSSCPASRWAVVEMKMMIAVLIASFEFTGASPMSGHNFIVTRPYVLNQFERGHRMPLCMTPL